jgi:anthranilate 1,2-dioxygenase large subunit
MGGVGKVHDTDYLSQEISIRGFWQHYHHMMGFAPAGPSNTEQDSAA